MLATENGGPGGYMAQRSLTSKDGITGRLRAKPLRSLSGGNAIDPSIELVDGRIRAWFAFSPEGDMEASRIASGVLTLGP